MTAPAIEVDHLHKSFHARRAPVEAVRGISFAVAPGEIFGLLGPNGAGKTTTLRMLATLLPIDSGRALVAGADVAARPAEVRRKIGYVSQLGGADTLATGRENLMLQGALYGTGRQSLAQRVHELVDQLGLAGYADRRVKTYSGGQRRRLDVALGLVHRPAVLFLDEPTTGLDPQNRANMWDRVRALAAQGTTVVLTTHYLEEADALCGRVVIVDHGRIVAEGSPEELKRQVAGAAISLSVKDPGQARNAVGVLRQTPGVHEVVADGVALRLRVGDGPATLPELLRRCEGRGIGIGDITLREPSLDDVFLSQTGRSLRDTDTAPARHEVRVP